MQTCWGGDKNNDLYIIKSLLDIGNNIKGPKVGQCRFIGMSQAYRGFVLTRAPSSIINEFPKTPKSFSSLLVAQVYIHTIVRVCAIVTYCTRGYRRLLHAFGELCNKIGVNNHAPWPLTFSNMNAQQNIASFCVVWVNPFIGKANIQLSISNTLFSFLNYRPSMTPLGDPKLVKQNPIDALIML